MTEKEVRRIKDYVLGKSILPRYVKNGLRITGFTLLLAVSI